MWRCKIATLHIYVYISYATDSPTSTVSFIDSIIQGPPISKFQKFDAMSGTTETVLVIGGTGAQGVPVVKGLPATPFS
jgi:hypothetical protein